MFKNYIKVAYRSLARDPFFSLLNVIGLTAGIAAFLLISLYVSNELGFDKFHEKGDRIYAHVTNYYSAEGTSGGDSFSVLAGKEFDQRIPQIEKTVQLSGFGTSLVTVDNESFYQDHIYYSDNDIFDVFDFPIINGKVDLLTPYKAVITESMAKKYFGDQDPVGQTFLFKKEQEYEVVAVAADLPSNSYIQFSMLLSEHHLLNVDIPSKNHIRNKWGTIAYTYFLLSEGATEKEVTDKMLEVAEAHFPQDVYRNDEGGLIYTPIIMSYEDIHLKSRFTSGLNRTGDIRYVYLFSAIALLILLIACVNYINLSTAKSIKRAKETGLRKVIGASKSHLVRLHLMESFVLTTLSVFLAFALAERLLPYYNNLIERELVLRYWGLEFFATIVVINVLVSLLAGAYPAFKLSSYKPLEALRGSKDPKGKSVLRKSLVLIQFLIAQILIIATIIIQNQLSFLQNKDLGYNRDHALYIDTHGELDDQIDVFKEALKKIPTINSVGLSDGVFTWATLSFFQLKDIEGNEENPDGDDYIFTDLFGVDHDFVDVMGIEMEEGRGFDKANSSDLNEAILINRAAAERFGWENPVGKRLKRGKKSKYVIGVMKDFHNESLRAEIKPVFIELKPNPTGFVSIRIAPEDVAKTMSLIKSEWDKLVAERPFESIFYDDKFDQHYRGEQRLGNMFVAFAGLAITISLLGLIGLTAFSAEQRLKEIGIRKVLGASVRQLMMILSKEFILLIGLAFIIAAPITYYAMDSWLVVFKYRIDIGASVYLLAIVASIGVAWSSISFLSIKVAKRNPVDILRTE